MPRSTPDVLWTLKISVYLLISHALAYLTHEYAHSLFAWLLGWMASPGNLDYGHLSPGNVLLLSDVSDNVNYESIFAHGEGLQAAVIALAGPFIGNGLLYVLNFQLAKRLPYKPDMQLLAFCFGLMCAGNLWSYVPIRSLTTHADIALAAQGLGISVWLLFPFVLVPSVLVSGHFFTRACLRCWLPIISGKSEIKYALLCTLTAYWFFVFFGEGARSGSYGTISQVLSFISVYMFFPLSTTLLWWGRNTLSVTNEVV